MTHPNNMPLVSIGIPTYNRADSYLRQALESAMRQTYPHIEIIVSDNCSADNTEEVVKSYNDPRIRYFKQKENIGRCGNSNFVLQQARGDYFQQLQDDDLIDHDFLDTCMQAAGYSRDIGIIQTGTRIIDSNGQVIHDYPNRIEGNSFEDYIRGWFACKAAWYLCSTLFNTKCLKEIGGFKSKHYLFDDVVAMVQLAAKYKRINIEGIKASFRKHMGEETFSVKVKNWSEDSIYLLDLICDIVDVEYRQTVRREGMQFFSMINYGFARAIMSPINRLIAYIEIYKTFNYKYLPPPFKKFFLYINPVYGLKFTGKQIKKILS